MNIKCDTCKKFINIRDDGYYHCAKCWQDHCVNCSYEKLMKLEKDNDQKTKKEYKKKTDEIESDGNILSYQDIDGTLLKPTLEDSESQQSIDYNPINEVETHESFMKVIKNDKLVVILFLKK